MATKYKTTKKDNKPKVICQNPECIYMGKKQSIDNFYKSRNNTIPYHPFCKDCLNKKVDGSNMQDVYDVLQVLDTPFIMDVWNKISQDNPKNILSAYLKAMNFQYRKKYEDFRFEDSIYELDNENEEIDSNVQDALDSIPQWSDDWQGKYTKSDLKYLNDYYQGLNKDFKIITTNHKDYARKIAQASLSQCKAFQLLQEGKDGADIAYEKATKLFDMLSKSAQFAESQRGANDVALGCFGRVFDAVEKHNWVPQHIPDDDDMYDKLLKQFSNIERSI